ncbi:MAG: WecB/TagA/CpsF family glycosyltransferase [Gammaproteobacteria bacterium]|nr:WecB/TagA/CpsF family glycosyltransferase [Gammaproteobacteria bacterium]
MTVLETEDILGYPVTSDDKNECIDLILEWIEDQDKPRYFVCANPHSIQVAEKDRCFKDSLRKADLVTPDGIGVVLASKILGGGIKGRVTGSDIFWGLSKKLNECGGKRYFFLGSTEELLGQIREKMAREYPGIVVAGTYSPPFKLEFSDQDIDEMVKAINAAGPDVLWVGMTAPKQEKWIYTNRDKLDVRFIGAIGAVFDFYVGCVRRSPPIFQRLGLEWLPRFLQEPRRLWRRNFISNPTFMCRVLREKYRLQA